MVHPFTGIHLGLLALVALKVQGTLAPQILAVRAVTSQDLWMLCWSATCFGTFKSLFSSVNTHPTGDWGEDLPQIV